MLFKAFCSAAKESASNLFGPLLRMAGSANCVTRPSFSRNSIVCLIISCLISVSLAETSKRSAHAATMFRNFFTRGNRLAQSEFDSQTNSSSIARILFSKLGPKSGLILSRHGPSFANPRTPLLLMQD